MRSQVLFIVVLVALVLLVGIGLALFSSGSLDFNRAPGKAAVPSGAALTYNPPKPEDAPQDIRDAVLLGHSIISDTQKTLSNDVGNQVNCTNCHFNAGVTQGGQNGGISLVGVAATYPKYRERQKYAVDLVARLND